MLVGSLQSLSTVSDYGRLAAYISRKPFVWTLSVKMLKTIRPIDGCIDPSSTLSPSIGVASYGALGHVPLLYFQLFDLSGQSSELHKLQLRLNVVAYPIKIYRPNSDRPRFVTVYCIHFIILLCVTLKLSFLSFVPLLAPNPSEATESKSL